MLSSTDKFKYAHTVCTNGSECVPFYSLSVTKNNANTFLVIVMNLYKMFKLTFESIIIYTLLVICKESL